MKYNDNGEYKEIVVKSVDTLPVGTEVDFDGSTVPSGWEEVSEWKSVNYTDYLTFESIVTSINSASAIKKGNMVYINYDIVVTTASGVNKIATILPSILVPSWGSARVADNSNNYYVATLQISSNKNFNIYTNNAGVRSAGAIMLFLA